MTNLKGTITRRELASICEGLFDVKSITDTYNYIRKNRTKYTYFDVIVNVGSGKVYAGYDLYDVGDTNCIFLFRTIGDITLKEFVYHCEISCRGHLKNPD